MLTVSDVETMVNKLNDMYTQDRLDFLQHRDALVLQVIQAIAESGGYWGELASALLPVWEMD